MASGGATGWCCKGVGQGMNPIATIAERESSESPLQLDEVLEY